MRCKPLIDHELTQRSTPSGFPVGVIAASIVDQLSQLASAGGGSVANGVRDLMSQPERDQLWIQAQALRFGVGNARKMLEADKCDPLSVNYQLAGVGGAHAYHEHDVDVGINIQQRSALLFGVPGERNNVDSLEHGAKVYTARKCGRANDFQKMWSRRIEDVVVPV